MDVAGGVEYRRRGGRAGLRRKPAHGALHPSRAVADAAVCHLRRARGCRDARLDRETHYCQWHEENSPALAALDGNGAGRRFFYYYLLRCSRHAVIVIVVIVATTTAAPLSLSRSAMAGMGFLLRVWITAQRRNRRMPSGAIPLTTT